MTGARSTIVTPTYRPDLQLTRDLCASIDRYFAMDYRHLVIVPRSDRRLFADLAGPRRDVLIAEDVLGPLGFFKLPLPSRIRIPGLVNRRLREQWIKRGQGRVGGWLVQQIIKLASAGLTQDELLVFIDSDLHFIRTVDDALYRVGDKVRLHRNPGGLASAAHHDWRRSAIALLGLDGAAVPEEGYIGNVVTWRRPVLQAMLARIEAVTGTDWASAVVRAKAVSEYMLYGYFAAHGGAGETGHAIEPFGGVHSLWRDTDEARDAFLGGLRPEHVAIHIQSAITTDPAARAALIAEAARRQGAA